MQSQSGMRKLVTETVDNSIILILGFCTAGWKQT